MQTCNMRPHATILTGFSIWGRCESDLVAPSPKTLETKHVICGKHYPIVPVSIGLAKISASHVLLMSRPPACKESRLSHGDRTKQVKCICHIGDKHKLSLSFPETIQRLGNNLPTCTVLKMIWKWVNPTGVKVSRNPRPCP